MASHAKWLLGLLAIGLGSWMGTAWWHSSHANPVRRTLYGVAHQCTAQQINGYFAHFDPPPMDTDALLDFMATPPDYRAWVLVHRGWLLSTEFLGGVGEVHLIALPEGRPERRRSQFENYLGYLGYAWDDWITQPMPEGLDVWLTQFGLQAVLTQTAC